MKNYRVTYKDYYGEVKEVMISAENQEKAIQQFNYDYGDCKLLIIH